MAKIRDDVLRTVGRYETRGGAEWRVDRVAIDGDERKRGAAIRYISTTGAERSVLVHDFGLETVADALAELVAEFAEEDRNGAHR
jgi:hypothetical protein